MSITSPTIIGGVILFFLVSFIALLVFFPFLLFTDSNKLSTNYATGVDWMTPTQLDADGTAYFWPAPSISRVSSPFGSRDLFGNVRMHKGIDIANGAAKTELQPIYAMASGTVTLAGAASGYGYAIYIDHGDGLVSKYGHLATQMDVRVGDVINKGQRIGRIGAGIVGRSTGSHLHFQVEVNGQAVDPLKYVQEPGTKIISPELSYRPLDIEFTLSFLTKRKSMLADRSILQMIDQAGKEKNVAPQLLIAITGQEQGFVPNSNNHANEIVKNPWNVFGCWCKGKGATLTTEKAAKVAASTIVKLSDGRPEGRDPIEWLSAKDNPKGFYADHSGWWIGVSKYYKILLNGGG